MRRGYILCFEGPGQTGAFLLDPSLTYRYDWEVPTAAVLDYLVSRPEVDADRIAFIGYSWGGYFVPRAAAFDKRIAACVGDCLLPDVHTPVIWTMGVEDLISAGAAFDADQLTAKQRYSLEEGMPRFGFPNGIDDLPAWAELLNRFVLTSEEQGAEMHTRRGNSSLLHQIDFDWLDEILER